ncbi:thaumatin-like protein 1b isoform X1 [Cucumis melo var. makuwa]|uniref:Thaumatin-like protein 1b isoform X1 n=1 Tax=Cucumis melo var. makuwa TaxID=1194695 RepID=A0A5A7UB72_CUCMM|nr:thaumatin-like protein 1b isoform X1 [Cucumis melo var. makuwa]TYK11438.1 thaumatin-like protein 1b isoform X1 [Cucumis melo var. makuwa]
MATMSHSVISLLLSFSFSFFLGGNSATFTILNQCDYTVWPGLLSGAGTSQPSTTGFVLEKGQSNAITMPPGWSGRIWGRTYCSQDATGRFTCATADCGSGTVECNGNGATPPATLTEFTLNGANGLDFYDVSLVDGYNVPMLITPQDGTGGGNCTTIGCATDLNSECPAELRVVLSDGVERSVACKSACEAFGDAQYCCSGEYGSPNTCRPSSYSQFFKSACPHAYSYAYDDGTSTFTCTAADYLITFCPPSDSYAETRKPHGQRTAQEPSVWVDRQCP